MADEPGIGSSLPVAALNPLTFPEKFSTKNRSDATGRGGGVMEELPPPQPTASVANQAAASVSNFCFTECFRETALCASCFHRNPFGSQRICPFSFAPFPSLYPLNPAFKYLSKSDAFLNGFVAHLRGATLRSFTSHLPITYPTVPVTIPPNTSAT